MTLKELIAIRGRLTTDTELARVVDQINIRIKDIQNNNIEIEDAINLITPYLLTPDTIINKSIICEVNNDFDLTYTDDGEVITDG